MAIPNRVLLSAIGYNVIVHDGMVMFSDEPAIAGCDTKLVFQRCCGCWYVEIHASSGHAMFSHVAQAMALVKDWFGGNFICPRGENVP